MAATTVELKVDRVLQALLDADELPRYDRVKAAVAPEPIEWPVIELTPPDLTTYDALLEEVLV